MGLFSKLFGRSKQSGGNFKQPNSTSQGCPRATLLFQATYKRNVEAVRRILKEGADPNVRSFAGYQANPSSIASEPGIPYQVLNIMRQQAASKKRWPQLFLKPELGFTNLYFPSMTGDVAIVRLLLEAGADPNGIQFNGLFPLYVAAEYNHVEILKELVQHGANVNQTTPKGCTALLNAAEEGNKEAVIYLLQQGADPTIANQFGKTPRRGAAENGHYDLAGLL